MMTLDDVVREGQPVMPVNGEAMETYAKRVLRQGAILGAQWGIAQMGPAIVIIGDPIPVAGEHDGGENDTP